ncbi:MAG TPA: hypothetical protein VMA36_12950 [Candidatus Limnocylindria bacterium]|jgi:hypothetical protein|nr:hypothetical protein [Candidatus Limnocylindria bacterium]
MLALRVALAIGLAIDLYVAVLSLFAPQLIQPLLDIPVHDPTLAQVAGGEYVVAALCYALALRDPRRYPVLLWICALDQAFAVVLPALAVVRGQLPATWKILAPIPFQALLVLVLVAGAVRLGRKRRATPFMQ